MNRLKQPTELCLYDPRRVRRRLLCSLAPRSPLPLSEVDFAPAGPGVYVIYFRGPRQHLYGSLAEANWPLYVGKASHGLRERLKEHRKSVAAVGGIEARHLVVKIVPMPREQCATAEEYLINHFRPVWNGLLPGFGSKGTLARRVSPWDQMHPGRPGRSDGEVAAPRELRDAVREHIHQIKGARSGN